MNPLRIDTSVAAAVAIMIAFAVYPDIARCSPGSSYAADIDSIRRMISLNQYREAEAALSQRILDNTRNPELFAYRGRVRIWSGNKTAGLEDLRQALSLREDDEVRRLLVREEAAEQVKLAEELLRGKSVAEGEALLRTLMKSGEAAYAAGLALGRHYRAAGNPFKAAEVYRRLCRLYPDDHEIAYLEIRSLSAAGATAEAVSRAAELPDGNTFYIEASKGYAAFLAAKDEEAAAHFRRALLHHEEAELRAVLTLVEKGLTLKAADRALAEERDADAEKLLKPLFDVAADRYEPGIRLVRIARKRGDYVAAAAILSDLRRHHPHDHDLRLAQVDVLISGGRAEEALAEIGTTADTDFLLRKARALYRLHRYREAMQEYLLLVNHDGVVQPDEVAAAEQALFMEESLSLIRTGRVREGEALWRELLPERRDRYAEGYEVGMSYFRQRDFARASSLFDGLSRDFPADPGLLALAVEAHLLNGESAVSSNLVASATPVQAAYLSAEREDLLYRIRTSSLKISGSVARYDNGAPVATEVEATLAGRFSRGSYAVTAGSYRRFGETDTGAAAEIGLPCKGRPLRATLGLSLAPGAAIIPRYGLRTEFTRTIGGGHELSVGYTQLSFARSSTDIAVFGFLASVTPTMTLNERIYLVPASGSWAAASTLHYERHRLRGFYTLSVGTAAEQQREAEAYRRYLTFSNRIGTEYRPLAAWSAGGEVFQEYRDTLYSRYGSQLFIRHWW